MAELPDPESVVVDVAPSPMARRLVRAAGRLLRRILAVSLVIGTVMWLGSVAIKSWGRWSLNRRMQAAQALKGGQQYFVDPAGNDTNDGRAPDRAWRSLARASGATFAPGDSLMLTGGIEYVGTLHLDDDDGGDPSRPFVVTSRGPLPATITPADSDGVVARNPIGLTISRLIVRGSGASSNKGSGIALVVTARGSVKLPGIVVEDVDVSGMGRFGLVIDGKRLKSGLRDVRITDSDFHANQLAGLSVLGRYVPFYRQYAHANVLVEGVRAWDNTGDPTIGDVHSGSGIVMSSVRSGTIRRCVAWNNGAASRGHEGGPFGIWTWSVDSVLLERSVSFDNRTASAADGGGFDFDGGTTNSLMRDNVSFDNDGAGVLLAQFSYALPFHDNRIERHVSIDDARKNGYGAFTAWGAVFDTELHSSVLSVRAAATTPHVGIKVYANAKKTWWERGTSRNIRIGTSLVLLGPGVEFMRSEAGAEGLDVGGAIRLQLRDEELPRAARP